MHSEHRRRYHLRPLADVHPGDRVSIDADAIAAVQADRSDEVDWGKVDQDAAQVLDRFRLTPTRLSLEVQRSTRNAGIEGHVSAPVLLHKPDRLY